MHISNDIRYIGVNDHQIDLFEGQYIVPNGMAYNSYVIMDEKIAVLDTVDQHFGADWFANLEKELDGRQPDYLVVHHMEPDHSANIGSFAAKYPNAKIVASLPAFNMMKNYYETDFPAQKMVVKEGSTLELGQHTLTFIGAAMVHWPEVLMSYESTEKVLFTADAFGKFGALDVEEDWACEARRYYIGIVGKFGAQVQTVLKKAAALDIQTICPLHGPVLTENLGYYINLYNIWSSYAVSSLTLTPMYLIFSKLGFLGNHLTAPVAIAASSIPFVIVTLRPYFRSIPVSLDEAARLDGCGSVKAFLMVMLPAVKTGIITIMVISFLNGWNDLVYSMTFNVAETMRPLTANIYKFQSAYGTRWNCIMAYGAILVLPVILMFIFLQKYIVGGLVAGAVKD